MFGQQKGLMDLLKEKRRSEAVELPPIMEDEDDIAVPQDEHLAATVKKKRQSQILKRMLHDNGYGDLARMISIHEQRG